MNSILKWVLGKVNPSVWMDYIAGFIVDFIPGFKTHLLGILGLLIGVYNWFATPEHIKSLCDANLVCLEGNPLWGKVITAFAFLLILFRKATEQKEASK